MITHDPTFETAAKAPVKQTHVIVARQIEDAYGSFDDPTRKWESNGPLMSVKIDCVGSFLGTVTKKATVKLLYPYPKPSTDPAETVVQGDVFQIRLGINPTPNPEEPVTNYTYISEGFFLVEEVDYNYESGYITVTMYDNMWRAQQTSYTDTQGTSGFSYPTTIEGLATEMASAIGVEIMADFDQLPNASFAIEVDPYANISNATLQTVIQEIAAATGTTARITDQVLYFVPFEINPETLDSDTLKQLTIGKKYGPVTSVILGRVPQNDNIVVSNLTPTNTDISNVNTSTNLLTVTGNEMVDGNLVRIASTGTYPAPLQPNTNYYVFTDGDPDTFALAETYDDAIAGTNLIDITTAGSGTLTLDHLETQEVQINNNQLLDDDRQAALPPLYASLVGSEWNEVKVKTVGLGWHEVADVIQFTQSDKHVNAFISEVHYTLEGSIVEEMSSVIPDVATIDYQTAGGILKTIYNTEIKVDKQQNEITSVVSQQDIYATQVQENLTQIYQNLENILLTVQKSGGGNLILNSVGFATDAATDDDNVNYQKFSFWEYNPNYDIDDNGTIISYSSSESQNAGGVSGEVVEMAGTDLFIEQTINVAANTPLSFGLRVRNAIGEGSAKVTLYNDNDTYELDILDTQAYNWEELVLEDFVSTMPWINIKVEIDNATRFRFTDLRLLYGSTLQGWVQSPNEILSTNVQFTKLGMRIFDNFHDTETQVTYNEFSTRRRTDGTVLFEADDSGVVTNDLSIKGSTTYMAGDDPIIKQITIPASSDFAGIAFIRVA